MFLWGFIFMKKNSSASTKTRYISSILFSTLLAAIVCAFLYVITALLFTKLHSLPYVVISQLSFILSAIAALIGGIISAKFSKSKGLITGTFTGFLLFVIIFVVYYIILRESFTTVSLIRALALVLSGAIGGIIGVNKKRKRK